MKHNKGCLPNAFTTTNTRTETNASMAQTNLFIVTVKTITLDTKTQQAMDKILTVTDVLDTCKTIAHTFLPPSHPKHPAGNCPTDIYYADDDDHQQNQNDDDINEYHGDIHDNYHQEQAQEPPNNLPTYEPMDYTDH